MATKATRYTKRLTTGENTEMTHQENYLHQMIANMRTHLLTMGAKTQQALDDACYALMQRDDALARKVIADDKFINAMENEIDSDCLNILALSQPVAKDLRFAVVGLRMVLDVERIGDEAVQIAHQSILIGEVQHGELLEPLRTYSDKARDLLRTAMNGFRDGDLDLAALVCHSDVLMATLTAEMSRKIMDSADTSVTDTHQAMHALLIGRALDRVCHRAQNIAEHTYFMVKGVNIKHLPSDVSNG